MQAPRNGWQPGDDEFHREQISGITTALLALIGRNVEPVKDREHVLISNIFEYAWRRGQDLMLEDVILQVQKPPFEKLGVFDVDTFFPEKDRFKLAMEMNNIIAAPSFQSWIQGEPLDVPNLLYTPEGKARVSIFYIAHLSEAERMFIVTLLLENMLSWMRTLSGTTSLRALLYFDEVFGYFPPHPYKPPSKDPILRLLKQARAFGLGLILATQNPGDIDYKGLSNAGTWFIGKLQTENDKNKVLSGLESVATVDNELNIEDVDKLLSTIDPRVFVMHNVHDRSGPIPIHTRWAMSFLRGPLTRQQIRILMTEQRAHPMYPAGAQQPYGPPGQTMPAGTQPYGTQQYGAPPVPPPGSTPPPTTLPEMPGTLPEMPGASSSAPPRYQQPPPRATYPTHPPEQQTQVAQSGVNYGTSPQQTMHTGSGSAGGGGLPEGYNRTPPPISSTVPQFFLEPRRSMGRALGEWQQQTGMRADNVSEGQLAYRPILIAQLEVRVADRKSGLSFIEDIAYHVPEVPRAGLIRWDEHLAPFVDPRNTYTEPTTDAIYGDLAPGLSDTKRMTAIKKEVVDYIYKTFAIVFPFNSELDFYGEPGMPQRDFTVQASGIARQRRDDEVDKLMMKYDDKFDKLESRLRRAVRDMESEQQQHQTLRGEELFTMGEAAMSLLRGRTAYTLSRVSRTRRYRQQASGDIVDAQQMIIELEGELDETQMEMERDLGRIDQKWGRAAQIIEDHRITPYKKDIHLTIYGIGWLPQWIVTSGGRAATIAAW
ncbi:MAG: hypothetical protein K8S97_05945 [Anaerolineae bacterium]|nr:hypothetical protein [Anaerolineae bacterium]